MRSYRGGGGKAERVGWRWCKLGEERRIFIEGVGGLVENRYGGLKGVGDGCLISVKARQVAVEGLVVC